MMSKLFKWASARIVAAIAFALPLAAMAATTYSTDHTVTGSGTAYTSSAGNANVTWQNFNFRAAVDKDHLAHGYYFYLKDGDTDIGETDAAVKLDSITLKWGSNAGGGIGADDTPYLVVTTADDTPVIIGVSAAGAAFTTDGTSTFAFSDVVLASNAKYRFYFYKNDVTGLSVGATLTGATTGRVNGRYHNTSGDARADYNDIRCNGGAGYSVNCSFVVSPLETGDATVLETSSTAVSVGSVATPVVIEGKVADGIVEVGNAATVSGVFTVCGEATTLELTDSLMATAFYFPAAVTINASSLSDLDPTGDDVSKTTVLLSGALKYTTAPTVTLPAATAGMIYETNITASGISVTVVKGVDCVETIAGNTSWSTIKPAGWIDSSVGDKPAIAITYEGENPVTLTFDEAVTAGSLTLTGNIVVEASAAATFGTVTAGAGSVVEMANMTITTQAGAGTYRYRSDYPSAVPNQSLTYEYVGGVDSASAGTVNLNGMRGTVKTSGFMNITGYFPVNTAAKLDVVSGTTTLTAGGQAICGYITIREGATLVNTATDSLAYSSYNSIIDIYGTLDMGTSRWTVWSGAAINLRGGEVVGVGEGNNGALDFMGTCNVTAYANSTISANVKFRNALSNVTVNDGVTLTISGVTRPGYDGGGVTKKGAGTLKFTSDPYVPGGIKVEAGTLAFDTESDVDPVVTYDTIPAAAVMGYASQSNWKGTVVINTQTGDAAPIPLATYGNANSTIVLKGLSGSNNYCATAGGNMTVAAALQIDGNVTFNNGWGGNTYTFNKVTGGGEGITLTLATAGGMTGLTYAINELDYNGTIALVGNSTKANPVFKLVLGNIVKAGAAAGDKVVNLTQNIAAANSTETIQVDISNATLNGDSARLEVKSDGVYVASPVATITYADSTTEDSYDALSTILATLYTGYTPAKAGAVVTVLDGSDESFGDGLPAIYDYDSTEHTYTLKTMVVAYQVGMTTYYSTSLESVVEAAVLSDVSATLLVDLNMSSLPAGLVVPGSYGDDALHAITLDLGGKTITGPASGYALVNAGADITITGDGSVEGAGIVSNATSTARTTISSGTYTATGDLFANVEGATIAVSGGTYNKTVDDEYVASGYKVTGSGETYTVEAYWIYEAVNAKELTGAWSNEVTYAEDKVRIEDGNTYTASTPSAGQLVTIDLTLSFDGINEDDAAIDDAKAAVRLGAGANDGEFVFQLYAATNGVTDWVDVSAANVTATPNTDFAFTFVLDMTNRTYTASVGGVALLCGDTTFSFAGANATDSVQSIEFTGAGTVTSIEGSYEDAPAPVDVFVDGQTIGDVEINDAQATWLNGQTNYAALTNKMAKMSQEAFNNAHLLNLNILDENYQDYKKGDFVVTDFYFETENATEYVVVEVTLERHGAFDGGINGVLKLKGTSQLDVPFTDKVTSEFIFTDNDTTTLKCEKDDTTLFYKPVIENKLVTE